MSEHKSMFGWVLLATVAVAVVLIAYFTSDARAIGRWEKAGVNCLPNSRRRMTAETAEANESTATMEYKDIMKPNPIISLPLLRGSLHTFSVW